MIELAPDIAFLCYLGVTLAALLGLWSYHAIRASKRKLIINATELYICEYCQSVYLASRSDKLTRCPQCQSLNSDNVYTK